MSCNKCSGGCNTCSCTCAKPCKETDCACKVIISSDCVAPVTVDLECSGILKGQTLSEVLVQLDAYICEKFGTVQNFLQIVNIGGGSEIYKGVNNLGKKELRTLIESELIDITENSETITISVNEEALVIIIDDNQNNFARKLIINESDLPDNYTDLDVCDYILDLPEEERTILSTDSKWNIVIDSPS